MHTQRSSIGSFDLATDESSGLIILVEFTGFLSVSVKDRVALNCSAFLGHFPSKSRAEIILSKPQSFS